MAVANHSSCDTRSGDVECILTPGEQFTINFYINSLGSEITGYSGYEAELNYTGVTSQDNASLSQWPGCTDGFPLTYYQAPLEGRPGLVSFGCAQGASAKAPSVFTGLVGTNGFTCTQSGEITLVQGIGHTDAVDSQGAARAERDSGAEKLTIWCGPPPTATPPPSPTRAPGLPAGGTGGTGDAAGPWWLVGALLSAGAAAMVLSGWKLARSS